ncbi:MAG: hypothetical protein JRI58_11025 [Deltaproteobacteria bacterium]|nr:hypothetical protein [Deltaproteobacteria bacterium]MBW2075257.1 hypothetical protein [Deltaproteobacteria bacterium]
MKKRKIPFLLMILFVTLLVLGINLGEVSSVLEKATKLCLSCIGIG